MAKKPFIPALGLSLLVHAALLFSNFPKQQNIETLSESLGFRPNRYTIKSILTKDPVKKIVSKLEKTKEKNKEIVKKEKAIQEEVKRVVENKTSEVKSFDDSIIKNTPPNYPRIARKRGWQGDVELLISISPSGKVANVKVLSSNAHDVLIKSAIESASSWLFNPSKNQLPYQVKKLVKYQLR